MIQYAVIVLCDLIVTGYYFRRFLTLLITIAEMKNKSVRHCAAESGSLEKVVSTTQSTVTNDSSPSATSPDSPSPETSIDVALPKLVQAHTVKVDYNLINLITKSTLLNLIGVLSSCMVIGYLVYAVITDTREPFIAAALRCLDGVINTTCIFLVFAFSSEVYNFGCKYCHRGLREFLRKRTKRHVKSKALEKGLNTDLR